MKFVLLTGREEGEEKEEDGPCQAPYAVQPTLCKRCGWIWSQEGTQLQLSTVTFLVNV